jgi:hypothetical protein
MLPCAYKELFGIACPTCGAQRSFSLLMEGNFSDSFFMYPPLIPVLLLGSIWIARLSKPSLIDPGFIKKFTWTVLAMVLINYAMHFII